MWRWIAALAACREPIPLASPSPFDGETAGETRVFDGQTFAWAPAGAFEMGSPADEPERRPDERRVAVTLTRGFWVAVHETTQADWKRVMGPLPGPPTDELPEQDDLPVGNVNFAQAEAWCDALTERLHASGELPADWVVRLPTEAQWEYAARAGTTTATSYGASLSWAQANFRGAPYNGGTGGAVVGRATPVGSYPPNPWGLFDVHGNTYEWTRDWYRRRAPGGADPDLHDAEDLATPSEHGTLSRVRRGGAWTDDGWACRSAFRLRFEPERGWDHIGFRVVAVRL
jgi:formylglycine-generating enzyme required for sulfatase activity